MKNNNIIYKCGASMAERFLIEKGAIDPARVVQDIKTATNFVSNVARGTKEVPNPLRVKTAETVRHLRGFLKQPPMEKATMPVEVPMAVPVSTNPKVKVKYSVKPYRLGKVVARIEKGLAEGAINGALLGSTWGAPGAIVGAVAGAGAGILHDAVTPKLPKPRVPRIPRMNAMKSALDGSLKKAWFSGSKTKELVTHPELDKVRTAAAARMNSEKNPRKWRFTDQEVDSVPTPSYLNASKVSPEEMRGHKTWHLNHPEYDSESFKKAAGPTKNAFYDKGVEIARAIAEESQPTESPKETSPSGVNREVPTPASAQANTQESISQVNSVDESLISLHSAMAELDALAQRGETLSQDEIDFIIVPLKEKIQGLQNVLNGGIIQESGEDMENIDPQRQRDKQQGPARKPGTETAARDLTEPAPNFAGKVLGNQDLHKGFFGIGGSRGWRGDSEGHAEAARERWRLEGVAPGGNKKLHSGRRAADPSLAEPKSPGRKIAETALILPKKVKEYAHIAASRAGRNMSRGAGDAIAEVGKYVFGLAAGTAALMYLKGQKVNWQKIWADVVPNVTTSVEHWTNRLKNSPMMEGLWLAGKQKRLAETLLPATQAAESKASRWMLFQNAKDKLKAAADKVAEKVKGNLKPTGTAPTSANVKETVGAKIFNTVINTKPKGTPKTPIKTGAKMGPKASVEPKFNSAKEQTAYFKQKAKENSKFKSK